MAFVMFETTAHAAPKPTTTTLVTIHKIVSTHQLDLKDTYGELLNPEDITNLWEGANAVENNTGVQFTVWEIVDGKTLNQLAEFSDVILNEMYSFHTTVDAGSPYSFGNGIYYVRETKHPATLKSSIGVPFIMELPVLNKEGTEYLGVLHLYPKNIIEDDMPSIDKDVEVKGQDHASFDIGNPFDYLIYPKVPKGIQDYTVFKVSDTLENTLDYLGSLTIKYNGVTFNENDDYTLAQTMGARGSFIVLFTKTGLKKLADNRPEKESLNDLEIRFQASINKNATMGKDIYNNAVLTYNNGYFTTDQTTDVPLINQPEVHTGGRKFIKIDNVAQKYLEALSTATFCVTNNINGKYMIKDSTTGEVSWTSDPNLATIIHVSNDGTFEVTGLAYGNYTLKEINAPTDYIKMDDLAFTIDKYSYGNQTEGCINTITKVINVKKPSIPQTGGIGAIIFLAAGLALMGAAVFALKRKEHPEK